MCVCVCERERESESQRKLNFFLLHSTEAFQYCHWPTEGLGFRVLGFRVFVCVFRVRERERERVSE